MSPHLEALSEEERVQAVTLFNQERDIPYRIELDPNNLELQTWNDCIGKAIRLQQQLQDIGIDTKFGLCNFRWSDLDLPYYLLKVPHNDNGRHVFPVYKYVDAETGLVEWRILDPTWNPGVRRSLKSNSWDGIHGTACGVIPISTIEIVDPSSEEANTKVFDTSWVAGDLEENGTFYYGLNYHLGQLENQIQQKGDKYWHDSLGVNYPFT